MDLGNEDHIHIFEDAWLVVLGNKLMVVESNCNHIVVSGNRHIWHMGLGMLQDDTADPKQGVVQHSGHDALTNRFQRLIGQCYDLFDQSCLKDFELRQAYLYDRIFHLR